MILQAHTFEAQLGLSGQWGSSKRTLELAKLGLEDCRSGQVRLIAGDGFVSFWVIEWAMVLICVGGLGLAVPGKTTIMRRLHLYF